MNGAQDLGGQMGFGAVQPEIDEPIFHAEWEKRVLAINVAAGAMGAWTIDGIRAARESLPPAQYLSSSYYEIWLAGLNGMLVEQGFVTPEELQQGKPLAPAKTPKRVLKGDEVATVLRRGFPYEREAEAPARFAVGDAVRTRVMHPQHHTRLPRY
ncbi:MAG: nitrile hydratase subunit beta, partial [Bosea sp. (in: a-proteobacteria)]|nr:nitrile hydratase subunit beta [Bosea sp. (in: a-proteobacteria)]